MRSRLTTTWRGMRAEVLRGTYTRKRAWVRLWLPELCQTSWAPMSECVAQEGIDG